MVRERLLGRRGAAVSHSRQTRTAGEYRTDPTNAPDLHTPVGVPVSGGSDSDSEGSDDSDTSALSDGVADWSGAEEIDFYSDGEQPAGSISPRREFFCIAYLFGRSRVPIGKGKEPRRSPDCSVHSFFRPH